MDESTDEEVSRLLEAVQRGDRSALDNLYALVYGEMRVLAHRQRRRWDASGTLNTTALVHEAYLKLVKQRTIQPANARSLLRTRRNSHSTHRQQLRARQTSQQARGRRSNGVTHRDRDGSLRPIAGERRPRESSGGDRRSIEAVGAGQPSTARGCRMPLLRRHVDRRDCRGDWRFAAYRQTRLDARPGMVATRDRARHLCHERRTTRSADGAVRAGRRTTAGRPRRRSSKRAPMTRRCVPSSDRLLAVTIGRRTSSSGSRST